MTDQMEEAGVEYGKNVYIGLRMDGRVRASGKVSLFFFFFFFFFLVIICDELHAIYYRCCSPFSLLLGRNKREIWNVKPGHRCSSSLTFFG